MKNWKLALVTIAALTASAAAFAGECVDKSGKDITNDPETFQALIQKSENCYEAKQLAEACAWGSSMDVQTAGFAYEVCANDMKKEKPGRALVKLEAAMEKACNAKYANMQGTMYRSMNAYCNLSALEWALGLATDE